MPACVAFAMHGICAGMTRKFIHARPEAKQAASAPKVSLNRALSKLGLCSRKQAEQMIAEGRVRVMGKVVCNPSLRVDPDRDRITVDGERIVAERKVYLMLNKPRGLVTTRDDPKGAAPSTIALRISACLSSRRSAASTRRAKACS